MSITLAKKQTVSLDKAAGNQLSRISMGLGWDAVKGSGGFIAKFFGAGGGEIDLDASCILMDSDKNLLDTVWFQQLKSRDGSVRHSGDNRTGDGDGDDETIQVDLQRLPSAVKHLVFTVNSFTGQNFNEVENAYCRIVDDVSGKELARYALSEKGAHTGVIMAYLTRQEAGWSVTALGHVARGRTVKDMAKEAINAIAA
ncbi:MAG: TerD family protein [Halomonadaceae bacterium]|nr:TerD family protein [Halomonadaceae bacterium]